MKERTKFVLEWERRWNEAEGGRVNMAELCRMFGVSRQTGYTWVHRFRAADNELDALAERSRRPKSSPRAVSPELEDLIVAARKLYPRWALGSFTPGTLGSIYSRGRVDYVAITSSSGACDGASVGFQLLRAAS
jgi:hypothetical protein